MIVERVAALREVVKDVGRIEVRNPGEIVPGQVQRVLCEEDNGLVSASCGYHSGDRLPSLRSVMLMGGAVTIEWMRTTGWMGYAGRSFINCLVISETMFDLSASKFA